MFLVFRKRAELAVATPGNQEHVVSVSEISFDSGYTVSPSLP